jgi:ribosomal protein L37AE/L43A
MDEIKSCPVCGKDTIKNSLTGKYHCINCNKYFIKKALCDKCENEVETLSACGSTQFFCNHCKDLKSRKVLEFFLKEETKDL